MPKAQGPPSKEAVVFVIDSNPSMNKLYPATAAAEDIGGDSTSTRLSCAKEALEDMVTQLMIRSKTNEVAVVVLKTEETSHHMMNEDEEAGENEAFPNLSLLPESGISKPTAGLLRSIRAIQSTTQQRAEELRGDLLDGLVLAADALYQKTFGKRYRRRIFLFTDAEHRVAIDNQQLMTVFESLKQLECRITVVGLDFVREAEFKEPIPLGENVKKEPSEHDDDPSWRIKLQNEDFLVSFVSRLGGEVLAASSLQKIASATLGDRPTASQRKNVELHVAPGLVIKARYITILRKENFPSLKSAYATLDEGLSEERDGAGEIKSGPISRSTTHFDQDVEGKELPIEEVTSAYIFGSDYIPMSGMDFMGLKDNPDPVSIKIMGYAPLSNIHRSFLVGPAYGITGHDSQRACAAIAALAEALFRRKMVAICLFTKMKNGDPVLGGLLPLLESADAKPRRLFFVQLPFIGDVQAPPAESLNKCIGDAMVQSMCDDLIDSLMLPNDVLQSENIPDPSKRSFYKTVKERVAGSSSDKAIVSGRPKGPGDPIATPPEILARSESALKAFRDRFPLEQVEKKAAKKDPEHWKDYAKAPPDGKDPPAENNGEEEGIEKEAASVEVDGAEKEPAEAVNLGEEN